MTSTTISSKVTAAPPRPQGSRRGHLPEGVPALAGGRRERPPRDATPRRSGEPGAARRPGEGARSHRRVPVAAPLRRPRGRAEDPPASPAWASPGARRGELRFRGHRQGRLGSFWRLIAGGVLGVGARPGAPSARNVRFGQVSFAVVRRVCLSSGGPAPSAG